ncbi:MAG TPA: hypothetical protein DD658_11285 [Deltaproteobacteria bacterium]|nr:MAG: hypothetical protein A2X88_00850 [Deltaproteobacteria bacterium GWC2_65_14]HBO70654.1 hypothetical protein [Deltaproteobacteria bacterium]
MRDLRLSFLPVLLIGALFLWGPGCFRSAYRPPEAAPREDAQRTAEAPVPESPPEMEEAGQIPRPVPGPVADGPEVPGEEIPAGDAVGSSRIPSEVAPEEHAAGPAPGSGTEASRRDPVHPPPPAGKTQGTREEGTPAPVSTERYLASPEGPPWVKEREELVYRVEFLGLTMGYARFSLRGKMLLEGKEVYHLSVRAWTSDLLSMVYPMNDTIEYYLDVETLAPVRQEHTKSRKQDDIAYFDQDAGTIVYRYKETGKVRKRVEALPLVYDPVSVAYYFRSRPLAEEEPSRHMYAGRKLWEVSAKPVGYERIRTDRGEFDTVMIRPVLRRNGNLEDKGDLRIWMTRDERHLPVRVYAKFKKIRIWTLLGELLPDRQGG